MADTTHRAPLPPGPSPRSVLQGALQVVRGRDPLAGLADLVEEHGDVVFWRANRRGYVVLRQPEHVEHVLVAGHDRYVKAADYRLLATVTGEGLLTNEGESWARQRRLMQPMFARRHLDELGVHMLAAVDEGLDGWTADGEVVDVAETMSALTLDVVGRALFGTSLAVAADRLRPAVLVGLRTATVAARLQRFLTLPRFAVDAIGRLVHVAPVLPPPLSRIHHTMRTIDEVVNEIIERRAAGADAGSGDLLDLLLGAVDDDGRPMPRRQVRDELVTLMLAGHETTANGLAWLWYLLDRHPAARERLLAEVDDAATGGHVEVADADRLVWTKACFQEAMRLYPPAWILEREVVADDEIGGYRIPRGTTVMIPVFHVHRDPRWWPRPESFEPERFLGAPPPRGTYLPFGAGKRVCIGASFALLEAALIVAAVSRRFTLDLAPGADVAPEPTVTLRPRHGLPMTVRPRGAAAV